MAFKVSSSTKKLLSRKKKHDRTLRDALIYIRPFESVTSGPWRLWIFFHFSVFVVK